MKEIDSDLLYKMGTKRPEPETKSAPSNYREDARKSIASALSTKFKGVSSVKENKPKEGVLSPDEIKVGMTVVHDRFGTGQIIKCEFAGGDALVTVDFDGMRKNMLARSAQLRRPKG